VILQICKKVISLHSLSCPFIHQCLIVCLSSLSITSCLFWLDSGCQAGTLLSRPPGPQTPRSPIAKMARTLSSRSQEHFCQDCKNLILFMGCQEHCNHHARCQVGCQNIGHQESHCHIRCLKVIIYDPTSQVPTA